MVLESLKSYFEDHSKYLKGNVDPLEFHKSFYLCFKLYRVSDTLAPKWTIFIPIVVGACGILAAFFCSLGFVHGISSLEIPLATENGTYFIVMLYKLLILTSTNIDKKYFRRLLITMKEDFKCMCSPNSKYRERYFQNQVFTRKASILSSVFILFIGGSMIVCANLTLVYHVISHEPNDGSRRPLPFPFWIFEVDLGKSPIYEFTFIFSNICVVTHVCTYIFMMQTQVVWVRQITTKADVITWNIQDLLIDVKPTKNMKQKAYYTKILKQRLKHIVEMHFSLFKLLEDYAVVYKKFLLFEQKITGPIVCLTAFGAAVKLDDGELHAILILLCVSVIVLAYIPSYMCTYLADKMTSVSDACWDTPFWNAGPGIRPYLILIMQRSMRPIPIQAPGFAPVSLQTYTSTLSSAYSAFNMLRQANFEL